MKSYIFLTNTLGGHSGGPSYIRNKKLWLEEQGWKVVAFDSTGIKNLLIKFPELKEYETNRIKELFYHPSWFNRRIRKRVIDNIIAEIDLESDNIVIESNTIILAEWGEIISEIINAKHLIYLIGENCKIKNTETLNFLNHKYKNRELFSISAKAFKNLWNNYLVVDDAEIFYWKAKSITQPLDINFEALNKIPVSDITITHFGRFKGYVSNFVHEICHFADKHNKKTINVVFFGITSLSTDLKHVLEQRDNILLYYFETTFPIPKRIFQISDVVVATAGCASIAVREGVKTISYNVETNLPLGLMRYTTVQSTFSDSMFPDTKQALHEILDDLLIKKVYNYPEPLQLPHSEKGYEYHVSFINSSKVYYKDILKINGANNIMVLIQKLMCKLGLVKIISFIR